MLRGLSLRHVKPNVQKFRTSRCIYTLPQPPSLPVITSIVVGLPLALWTYKCFMLVIFQRRVIYMGYAPLGARHQCLDDLPPSTFNNTRCSEVNLQGRHGAQLSGILVHRNNILEKDVEVVLVYFQGNAGNPLHRIPIFDRICNLTSHLKAAILAVAPRSYWKSTPMWPNEAGIIQDYEDTLRYALERFPQARIVLYGHSLGGAAAICTLAQLEQCGDTRSTPDFDRIRGLILENPFSSIPAMVRVLYPQKWLPYRYLAPLSFDKWDTLGALRHHIGRETVLGRLSREMLILLSEYDEIVPPEMGLEIFNFAMQEPSVNVRKVIVPRALHENAWKTKTWMDEIRSYLERKS